MSDARGKSMVDPWRRWTSRRNPMRKALRHRASSVWASPFCFCDVIKSACTRKKNSRPDVVRQFIETLCFCARISCNSPYWNDSRSATLNEFHVRGGDVAVELSRVFAVEIVRDFLRKQANHWLFIDADCLEQIICFLHDRFAAGDTRKCTERQQKYKHRHRGFWCFTAEERGNTDDFGNRSNAEWKPNYNSSPTPLSIDSVVEVACNDVCNWLCQCVCLMLP